MNKNYFVKFGIKFWKLSFTSVHDNSPLKFWCSSDLIYWLQLQIKAPIVSWIKISISFSVSEILNDNGFRIFFISLVKHQYVSCQRFKQIIKENLLSFWECLVFKPNIFWWFRHFLLRTCQKQDLRFEGNNQHRFILIVF